MDKFEQARYLSLRTFRRSGIAVDTPVWFARAGNEAYYVFSAADAGKVKRLRLSPAAQIATCDVRGGSLGEWQDCRAYLTSDSEEIAEALRVLRNKYGWQMAMTDFFSKLTGRYEKRAFIRVEV